MVACLIIYNGSGGVLQLMMQSMLVLEDMSSFENTVCDEISALFICLHTVFVRFGC